MKINIVVNPGSENEDIHVFETKEAALEFLTNLEDTSKEESEEGDEGAGATGVSSEA